MRLMKRERTRHLTEAAHLISDTDNRLTHVTMPKLLKIQLMLQTQFDNLSIKQSERFTFKTKQMY